MFDVLWFTCVFVCDGVFVYGFMSMGFMFETYAVLCYAMLYL